MSRRGVRCARRRHGALAVTRALAPALVGALALVACTAGSGDADGDPDTTDPVDVGDCTAVDVVVSSEKVALLTALAGSFNAAPASKLPDGCVVVRVATKASGAAMARLAEGWPDPDAERAQPGDVLGIEREGETTSLGETREDEDKRRRDAVKEVRDQAADRAKRHP